jgi:hypothetical protein
VDECPGLGQATADTDPMLIAWHPHFDGLVTVLVGEFCAVLCTSGQEAQDLMFAVTMHPSW